MAQDLGQDIATAGPAVTVPTADLTDGSTSAATAAVDFGTPTPNRIAYEWIQTTLASSAGPVFLKAAWSHDNTDFSDADNYEIIATMITTASTDKKKVGDFPCRARYAKFVWENQSGGSLDFTTSNSALNLWDNFGDQV